MRHTLATLTVTLTCALAALGNIYGTAPLANTVWTAGQSQRVAWMDDKSSPKLSKLGPVDIELYSGDDNLVATLASGIDAEDKSTIAWISPSWGHDGSDYYIAFRCKEPRVTRFTASFTIIGMAFMSSTGDMDSTGLDSLTYNSTTNGTHSGSATRSAGLSLPASSSSSAQPSSTLPPISSQDEEDYLRNHRGPGSATSGNAAFRVDYERLKFRLVFIIWPAVIGLTMAL